MSPNTRQRRAYMLEAYLMLASRRVLPEAKERFCWLYLLLWASLGGTPDEVIR